ncbi:hypothetical protein ACFYVL_09225 [Streptomyces sp. NPDC004111]|uniref:hypothetical protein n=1 Tax=Streptomyces sp. NPDC004111 TaxID=3364690 RepID=UPI003687C426
MTSDEPPSARPTVSSLDHRIEAVTGHDIDSLWTQRDCGVLDAPHTLLVDRHRQLVQAETSVRFYRTLLHRLSSGEFPIDTPLFERIDRTVDQLEDAATVRDGAAQRVLAALQPIETAQRETADEQAPLPAADRAALLSLAGGAKVHAHLLTGRMSVPTASGTRVPYERLQALESAGLVSRDTTHPVEAGQPVALTEQGRAALVRRPPPSRAAVPPASRPGLWPVSVHPRR